MIKSSLRRYQQEILDIIIEKLQQDAREIFVQMPTGAGKSAIIKYFAKCLKPKSRILIMHSLEIGERQSSEVFKECENITISTYRNIPLTTNWDYIILNELQDISEEQYRQICQTFKKVKTIICFLDETQRARKKGAWLNKKQIDYTLTLQQIIQEGYMNPNQVAFQFENFVEKLLEELKFTEVRKEMELTAKQRKTRIDFIVNNYEKEIIIEVKGYRSRYVQNTIIKQAVEQVEYYKQMWEAEKKKEVDAILILSCQVSEELKESFYQENGILIIDISNLLYLSQGNDKLTQKLIESITYNIDDIIPNPTKYLSILRIKQNEKIDKAIEIEIDKTTDFIQRLEKLECGSTKGNDKEYERLCVDIIKFLFKTEFTRMKEQKTTEDGMFRMDLICGLKPTSEFWRVLIQHYNTRFVVFEFKNYSDRIDQNLVYITEKYLYNAALRNVAIIISRNGFSDNAHKAATGILTENGKLVIDLKDDDMITMLRMKADGQDASDYLLKILEDYLISISK